MAKSIADYLPRVQVQNSPCDDFNGSCFPVALYHTGYPDAMTIARAAGYEETIGGTPSKGMFGALSSLGYHRTDVNEYNHGPARFHRMLKDLLPENGFVALAWTVHRRQATHIVAIVNGTLIEQPANKYWVQDNWFDSKITAVWTKDETWSWDAKLAKSRYDTFKSYCSKNKVKAGLELIAHKAGR